VKISLGNHAGILGWSFGVDNTATIEVP